MRRLLLNIPRRVLMFIALVYPLLVAGRLFAQDTITNVMSPVVSYQFYDSQTDMGTNAPISSQVVSYQFYDSQTDMGTNLSVISPVASISILIGQAQQRCHS